MSDEKPVVWTLRSALSFYQVFAPAVEACGYGSAIAGSIATKGISTKDLDLVLFPLTTANVPSKDKLMLALNKLEMRRVMNHFQVQEMWRRGGSQDRKCVEVWRVWWEEKHRRVDIFFLQ